MIHGKSDSDIIRSTHNSSRYFVESRHVAWVLLWAVLLWGTYSYLKMPQRKDPEIPVRQALAITPWPGATAADVEQHVTRQVEEKMTENECVERLESTSQTGLSLVYVTLTEKAPETGKVFDDIKMKLDGLQNLPQGAGPVSFIKDFGDTAALMLTVASPKADKREIEARASAIRQAIESVRKGERSRTSMVVCFPQTINSGTLVRLRDLLIRYIAEIGMMHDVRPLDGNGFIGFDALTEADDGQLLRMMDHFQRDQLLVSELHPDVWEPVIVRDVKEVEKKLTAVAGDKYSYRDMDKFTDSIKRTLQTVPQVSKITRVGVLKERVYLEYSQERLAGYGVKLSTISDILKARNVTLPGGIMEVDTRNLSIDPSGEFKSEKEIGDVVMTTSEAGTPVYLRDGFAISRDYESPAAFGNFYSRRDSAGRWQRSRAITLAVQMRPGEQIGVFGRAVDAALAGMRMELPDDLVLARTSDQPLQVQESIDLFMKSLYEAIGLVVLVALIGFREWRSALLMAASIPLTLAMTFGMMHLLGMDLQQVSIATLIIALGLLVDDPVVAGDAIKRELSAGHPRDIAAWLGPTKLATAILFATITNIVAYLPLLMLSGDTRRFLYSLPVVMACTLIASRIVSMTFIPFLGYYILRLGQKPELTVEERRSRGIGKIYYAIGTMALAHRWKVMAGSLVFLALGAYFLATLKTLFFPKDLSYLSYVDVWLPENASLAATYEKAAHTEEIIRRVADEYAKAHSEKDGHTPEVLHSLTMFVGGGAPRFWFSLSPEQEQANYAQILIQVRNSHDTGPLLVPLQKALSSEVAGARVDVRQLESGSTVGIPIQIRISGQDIRMLNDLAEGLMRILRSVPLADRVRDDWGSDNFVVRLQVDADRANLVGVTNVDVAVSTAMAISGYQVTTLREGDEQIPVAIRLRMEDRSHLADIQNLYVYSQQGPQKVPLGVVSSVAYAMETGKIKRRNQFRTVTVGAFPVPGALASEVLDAAMPRLKAFQSAMPPGYQMVIGGEMEEQTKGFTDLAVVMATSILLIFLALVFQFKNIVKPFIVFAAIPYGVVGSLGALWFMGTPFDFMAFLGIASLIGVIVSHIIVLFDFVEEMHAHGKPFRESVLDAGIARLRPVFITVGATVLGLVPLAMHGGPLWEPLCYAQIGGLIVANFITKLLVPAVYAICVLDLRIVHWEDAKESPAASPLPLAP